MPEPDTEQTPNAKRRRYTGLKIIVGGAAGLILSSGLCRVGFYLDRNVHDGTPSGVDALGFLGLVISVLVLLVGILAAIVDAMRNISHRDQP